MKIVVSACLLGEPCRYDGRSKPCEAVIRLGERHELIPVCPEVMGGLLTPRPPAELQADGRVMNREGIDVSAAYRKGAEETLRVAREQGCEMALLKEKSPSCGNGHIYDGSFTGTLIPGQGMTARLLTQHGICVLGETDLQSLFEQEENHGMTEDQ